MNELFHYCVDLLYYWAALTGLTYEEINVILFCILGPIVFILQWIWILRLSSKLKRLKKEQTVSPGSHSIHMPQEHSS